MWYAEKIYFHEITKNDAFKIQFLLEGNWNYDWQNMFFKTWIFFSSSIIKI